MLTRLLRQALDCGYESMVSHILNKLTNLSVADADFLDLLLGKKGRQAK